MAHDLESRLIGTRWGHITRDFFTNSAHFPIANIFLELLLEGPELLLKPDLYAMLAATMLQAYYLGSREYNGRPRPFLGNLIGPAIYTATELSLEGAKFFFSPNHIAYLAFAAAIGALQQFQLGVSGRFRSVLLITEHMVRTGILLAMYWIFESLDNPKYASPAGFVSDKSHVFIMLSLVFIGIVLGLANSMARTYLTILRATAHDLRRYSEWFLGKDILHSAVADPAALSIQRRERTLLFMDIRGFTQWSEAQPPEDVVDMLNRLFERSEKVWLPHNAIKAKFTGDEIMLVFGSVGEAARTALDLVRDTGPYLRRYGLSAGIGIHTGVLVEGLIGSREVKGYDVIGDTVNTAKRICDKAAGGEVLISQDACRALGEGAVLGNTRQITAKGKADPLTVHVLQTLQSVQKGD